MLKPLADGNQQLICVHWRSWPPPIAWMQMTAEEARDNKDITEAQYQRALVWKRVCGKKKMDSACKSCSLVRRIEVRRHEPYAVTLDGSQAAKIQDLQQGGALPLFRRGRSSEVASWISNIQFQAAQYEKDRSK